MAPAIFLAGHLAFSWAIREFSAERIPLLAVARAFVSSLVPIALRRMSNHASALRGHYPMLVLMVSYTATSLWIIAQPIVK